ncbi:MAG: serine/threonine protein kinase [Caldilineaceae bacterium]|nr:serine/threonine protein kinase [Caldilineaceae bacterium]
MQHILDPGTVLRNRYEILELVGQGGMGAVYKASDRRLEGRVCAVKEILPYLSENTTSETELEQITEQFRTEASILARLDHPHLPKVSDYFANGNREYLVMDFVEGRDLQELVQDAKRRNDLLSEAQVLTWTAQLLDALEYLHNQDPPVLHRDIKPSNIKVTLRGDIKLVDFGLVKVLFKDDSRTVTVVQGRGTVAYTPLEQYGGDTSFTDIRSDIYSLGATLYHLLAGQPPVDARERFLHPGTLESLRLVNPAVSPRVERAVFHALGMHPSERPSTIRELREMLLGSAPLSPHPPLITDLIRADRSSPGWRELFYANRLLLGLAFALALIAILISLP